MSDPNTSETDGPSTATAVATPPAPPAEPPVNGTGTSDGDRRKRRRTGMWVLISVAVALLMVGGLIWLVMSSVHGRSSATDSAAVQAAFASAMKKAGVSATYPAAAPVDLTTVVAKGSHPFTATFTPEEIGALLDTFAYTASVAGTEISLSRATVAFPAPGTIQLDAQVSANGNGYSGSVTAPAVFASGQVYSNGATNLTVEGIGASDAQKSQASAGLVMYANSLLGAAPGLKVDTASIQADGLHVSGTAPDSLSYP